ncbi:MAG: 2-pyrone-4,6-dicarboxylate hydrolase [Betaproteobacteria bacterium RIFCSPLOWO2_12_FULL_62_13b]|nr:MAG: 2-pyrone-4,6-dicarboxylate hydrolase [Betaproteobacteria bacterium RIFCSPLOWO2_12_FULL_62_13b]
MPNPSNMETVAPRMPSRPAYRMPPGACDTHAHVFGPYDRFPFSQPLRYPPPLAPLPVYLEMLAGTGAERGVLIQPAPYGGAPGALLDALRHEKGRLRGIASATAAISDERLAEMHEAGVRGLRFVEMPDPTGAGRYKGCVGVEELVKLAPRMKALGWHAQLWSKCEQLAKIVPELVHLEMDLAIDHMGWLEVGRGTADPAFQTLVALLREGRIWMKLSVCRNSKAFPGYEDLRPFHDALVAANPERLLWGSDWPFVRMGDLTPDPAHLVDLFGAWVDDEALRRRILVDNPTSLFGFEKSVSAQCSQLQGSVP